MCCAVCVRVCVCLVLLCLVCLRSVSFLLNAAIVSGLSILVRSFQFYLTFIFSSILLFIYDENGRYYEYIGQQRGVTCLLNSRNITGIFPSKIG